MQAEDAEVEFDTETDANGKLKAVNVTGVGGAPLVPPPRHKRRKPEKKEAPAESNGNNGGSKPAKAPREPPFHHVIKDDVKAKITSIPLVRNTVDVAIGGARIKLGQGGYASLVEASGQIGEGSFTCNEDAKVDFSWERCLELKDGNWVVGDVAKLLSGVSLTDGKSSVFPVTNDSLSCLQSLLTNKTCSFSPQTLSALSNPTRLPPRCGVQTPPTRKICLPTMASK